MRWTGTVARMGERRCKYGFGVETREKEITWKTVAYMGGIYYKGIK